MSIKRFLPFLLAFVLPLVVVYAWWGGFNPVTIEPGQGGPYTYAYVEHTGDYSGLPHRMEEARKALLRAGVTPGHAITVLYSHPEVVNVGERKSRAGFLVPEGTRVGDPLKLDRIPARPVLRVQVQAAILLAPSRAYQALDEHMQSLGSGIRMPTVEIYEASDSVLRQGLLTLEMDAPR